MDEVQTGGGATGKLWAHEHWDLPEGEEPDFVTFSKKMQTGGYFHRHEWRPDQGYRIFNTWMGEPVKLLQMQTILEVIERDGLLESTAATGSQILAGMEALAAEFPGVLCDARGQGTFLAVTASGGAGERDALLHAMRNRGMWVGGSGEASLRLRPALIFAERHAEMFLGALRECVKEMDAKN